MREMPYAWLGDVQAFLGTPEEEILRELLRQYGDSQAVAPRERVIVYDEAQRALDRDRVLAKHHGRFTDSEPHALPRATATRRLPARAH